MSDNQQPSSASALYDSAAGAVREGIAKVTGNQYDEAATKEKKSLHPPLGKCNLTLQSPLKTNGMHRTLLLESDL